MPHLIELNRIILLVFVSISLTACGGSSSGGGATDTTAPTISSTTPAASATSVARNSSITATFDEDIFATTVDVTSFTLAKSGNINGTVTFDGVTNVATFTPNNELDILATYTVSLSTAITDLSGNALTTEYNWSFVTVDGTWGIAELIENDNAGHAVAPQVAFDGSGNAIVVWYQQYDTNRTFSISANYFNGTSWGGAELIETDNTGDAVAPQVAVDGSGNAHAVWQQSDGTRTNIWANRFNDTNWGSAELIETDNTGDAVAPQVALDDNGNALAVWVQSDGIRNNIWANRFNGTSWGNAELIQTDSEGDAVAPQVAFDNNGNALAVWYQTDGTRTNIWANRFNGTNWGSAELIETDNAGDAVAPQVAFDNNGNAFAVWYQTDGTRTNIWANRFNGINWGSAELIETDSGDAVAPQVAFDDNGNALAVWQQVDVKRSIWANRFNGTNWGSAELIETDNTGPALDPQVAFDDNGNALAVWLQYTATGYNVWANRFNGTSWGSAELLMTENIEKEASPPQVAFDNKGNALAVWAHESNFINMNIWTNRFK